MKDITRPCPARSGRLLLAAYRNAGRHLQRRGRDLAGDVAKPPHTATPRARGSSSTTTIKESMRHVLLALVIGSAQAASAGCAALHGLDDYTTADPDAPNVVSTPDAAAPAPLGDSDSGTTACTSNQQCSDLATLAGTSASKPGPLPVVCVKATGTCVSLVSEDCPRVTGDYANDGAVVLGTLLGGAAPPSELEQAALLAVEEIGKSGGGLPPAAAGKAARPLVVVGCNVGADVLRATRHLATELRVAAIVGPTTGEHVVEITQQVTAKAGTLLMTPTSRVSSISNLADGDLTWRATPSDTQRAKLVIEQIKDLENVLRATRSLTTVKLGIVHSTDALGSSAREAISGKLIMNGRFITDAANAANVSVDAYEAGNVSAQAAVATKYAVTFKPDIVFITSAEQVDKVVVPLEQALTEARAILRPYYVLTDAARTQELLDAVTAGTLPLDIRRRMRGVGVRPDTSSQAVLEDFRAAFAARYGAPPADVAAAAVTYDATYAIAYALAASPAASGTNVAHGLRSLAVGSPAVVGARGLGPAMHELSSGKSVSLRGTFGLLQWDTSGDITGGTLEVWCLGTVGGAPAFGSSGLTMDVQTQVVGGAFVQCQ